MKVKIFVLLFKIMEFKDLDLRKEIVAALTKMGYTVPTKIQEEVILESKSGKNIIGQSQTGTGKTAAFVISALEKIDLRTHSPQVVILAPTRELVTQIRDEIVAISNGLPIRSIAVFGGSSIFKQKSQLSRGLHIVIGTPGRTIDLIERGFLPPDSVDTFILDEVDRMLDMGFVDDIEFIWDHLKNVKQTLAFSATITPEIKSIVERHLGVDYTFIKSTSELTVAKIEHTFVEVPHLHKYDLLKDYLGRHGTEKTIIFTQTKRETEEICYRLQDEGFKAKYFHGDLRQSERFRVLKAFQDGLVNIFVTTDIAARGLNMKNIELVVNFDVPSDPEAYIHRIGRTGRAGAEGKAVMFVSERERMSFRNVERRNKITINQVDREGNAMERTLKPAGEDR